MNLFDDLEPFFVFGFFDNRSECFASFVSCKDVEVEILNEVIKNVVVCAILGSQVVQVVACVAFDHFDVYAILKQDLHSLQIRVRTNDSQHQGRVLIQLLLQRSRL